MYIYVYSGTYISLEPVCEWKLKGTAVCWSWCKPDELSLYTGMLEGMALWCVGEMFDMLVAIALLCLNKTEDTKICRYYWYQPRVNNILAWKFGMGIYMILYRQRNISNSLYPADKYIRSFGSILQIWPAILNIKILNSRDSMGVFIEAHWGRVTHICI